MAANPSIQLGTDGNWAIKEDNLLAYKKDGTRFFNKEFDFTRGSLATFVDKDGLIKVSGVTNTKLVVNGDFATNLNGWTNSNNHWQWTSQGAYFPETTTHNPLSQTLVNDANVILKFTFTLNIIKGTVNVTYEDSTNASIQTQYTTSGTYTIYTTPVEANTTIYFSRYGGINTEFYLNNVSAFEIQTDVPRIDFTDDTTGHLLLEPQSTNLIPYSEDIGNSAWTTNSAGTIKTLDDSKIAPDNSSGVYKIENNSSSSNSPFCEDVINLTNGTTYTFSVYLYNDGSISNDNSYIYIYDTVNGQRKTYIDASRTNEWYRLTITAEIDISSTLETCGVQLSSGDGDSIYFWGAQVEEGYATSYIPTEGSIKTRLQDVCNNAGSSDLINSTEGVLYAEISALADDETNREITLSDGTTNNYVLIRFNSGGSNRIYTRVDVNTSVEYFELNTSYNITDNNKIAIRYKNSDFATFINGTKVDFQLSGNTFPSNTLNKINFDNGDGGNDFYGNVKSVAVFKEALTDEELAKITSTTQQEAFYEMRDKMLQINADYYEFGDYTTRLKKLF